MTLIVLASVALSISFLNALLFFRNLQLYRPPPDPGTGRGMPFVSVLIPARNEERSIEAAVRAALSSQDVAVEVIVLDDHSDDRTPEIVRKASRDPRLRLATAPELPAGWCGKQFACLTLAGLASYEILAFIDADVRLEPMGLARMVAFLQQSNADLVSGFPHQEVRSFYERLLLPLMHFLLLGFLPFDLMRRRIDPSLGAGCGQLFVTRRAAYRKMGGHAAIRQSRHDGISLPRAFRKAGLWTDLCDATTIAECRMYQNRGEVFEGLLKNATEGVAAPSRILIFTGLLLAGHVLPFLLLLVMVFAGGTSLAFGMALLAALFSLAPRIAARAQFRQPLSTALFHAWAVMVFLAVQWYALARLLAGSPATWKGRSYLRT